MKRQIREALDYDKNINRAVFAMEKKQVARMAEEVVPYTYSTAEPRTRRARW